MSKTYIAADYDRDRRLLRVRAQDGFGGDVYAASVEGVDQGEASSQVRAFAALYGADEVEVNGRTVQL
jgi:hypothetical protein